MTVHPTKSVRDQRTKPKSHAAAKSKEAEFEPLEHSVYSGRQRLGRYARIGSQKYAAYDAGDRHLGEFKSRRDAYLAVGQNMQCDPI
jgi:hypothetical protein